MLYFYQDVENKKINPFKMVQPLESMPDRDDLRKTPEWAFEGKEGKNAERHYIYHRHSDYLSGCGYDDYNGMRCQYRTAFGRCGYCWSSYRFWCPEPG